MSIEKQKRKELVVQHPKFEGIFINNAKSNALMTQNMVPGSSVYNEKRLLYRRLHDAAFKGYQAVSAFSFSFHRRAGALRDSL